MKRLIEYIVTTEWTLFWIILLIFSVGVFFIYQATDIDRGIEIEVTPDMIVLPEIGSYDPTIDSLKVRWVDDITNPDNQPYVLEVAFNLGIHEDSVTQQQFNDRYGIIVKGNR